MWCSVALRAFERDSWNTWHRRCECWPGDRREEPGLGQQAALYVPGRSAVWQVERIGCLFKVSGSQQGSVSAARRKSRQGLCSSKVQLPGSEVRQAWGHPPPKPLPRWLIWTMSLILSRCHFPSLQIGDNNSSMKLYKMSD